jgi:hypothetical protein
MLSANGGLSNDEQKDLVRRHPEVFYPACESLEVTQRDRSMRPSRNTSRRNAFDVSAATSATSSWSRASYRAVGRSAGTSRMRSRGSIRSF